MSPRTCLHAITLLLVAAAGCTVTTETSNSTDSCSADTTVTGCIGNSQGYSCTGSATPDDTVLNCSSGQMGNANSTIYCCLPVGASSSTCAPDPTVTTCTGGAVGYSCKGSDTPAQSDSTLTCSAGTPGNSQSTLFCCSSSANEVGDGGICTPTSIATCTGGSTGYTCTGSDTPTTATPGLACGAGTPSGTSMLYCCTTSSTVEAGTCAQDTTGAASCSGGAIGYVCSGSVVPSTQNPGLNCGAGTPWMAGETLFCCTTGASTDAGAACGVGVSSGSPTCDSCIEASCCAALTTCDTPDDGGINDAGMSQCEALTGCILDCLAGNPDAGVAPGTSSGCASICNPTYSASEQTNAQSLLGCEMTNCSTACQ